MKNCCVNWRMEPFGCKGDVDDDASDRNDHVWCCGEPGEPKELRGV